MRSFVLAFVAGAWRLQHEASLPALDVLPFAAMLLLPIALVPVRHGFARAALAVAAGFLAGYGWAASCA